MGNEPESMIDPNGEAFDPFGSPMHFSNVSPFSIIPGATYVDGTTPDFSGFFSYFPGGSGKSEGPSWQGMSGAILELYISRQDAATKQAILSEIYQTGAVYAMNFGTGGGGSSSAGEDPQGENSEKEDESKYNFGQGIYRGNNLFLEVYENYQTGLGRDFHLDVSILDFSNITQADLSYDKKTGIYSFDFYKANPESQEALTLGKISLIKKEDNSFAILPDRYDFNHESKVHFTKRNLATFGAKLLHHLRNPVIPLIFGGPFWIKFHGNVTIKP